jgi:alpha-tubulin suppressor-like RCC1 family protein
MDDLLPASLLLVYTPTLHSSSSSRPPPPLLLLTPCTTLLDTLPLAVIEMCLLPFLSFRDLSRLLFVSSAYHTLARRRLSKLQTPTPASLVLACQPQFPGAPAHVLHFCIDQPKSLACGVECAAHLTSHGHLYTWRAGSSRALVKNLPSRPLQVVCGFFTTMVRDFRGNVFSCSGATDACWNFVMSNVNVLAAGNGFAVMFTKQRDLWLVVEGEDDEDRAKALLLGFGLENEHVDVLFGEPASSPKRLVRVPLDDVLNPNETITHLACGARHFFALTSTHRVLSCGDNTFSQLGRPNCQEARLSPVPLTSITPGMPMDVACGDRHSVLLFRDGTVRVCGTSSCGELGLRNYADAQDFTQVLLPGPAIAIATGHRHTLVNIAGHSVFSFGLDADSQLGVQSAFWSSSLPRPSTRPFGVFPREIAAGTSFSLFLGANNVLYACGRSAMCGNPLLAQGPSVTVFTAVPDLDDDENL